MSILGDLFDPIGAVATDGNNNTFDSMFSPADNFFGNNGLGLEPSWQTDFTNSYAQPISDFGDNVVDANEDELRNLGNHFKSNPGQLFYSGADPFSTKVWNAATNQNNTPFLDQWGGETNADMQNSANRGINMQDQGYMSTLAHIIASYQAGGALGNLGGTAWGGVAGDSAEAGNTLGGFTGANAGGAADLAEGGAGLGAEAGGLSGDAQDIYNLERGGSALGSVGAYQAAGNATNGAAQGGANALDNNQNVWKGTFQGGLRAGLGSTMDYAGGLGIDDPNYKNVINGGLNGGVRAGMSDTSQTGYGALVGALGGLANSASSAVSSYLGSPSGSNSTPGQSGGTNWENLAAGLGNLYLANRNGAGIQGQINNLNSLYAPNSPYAQQMQETLQRQDAAAGRGSQYGTRAVQLQAALAEAASRNAPTLANLYAQQRQNRFSQLAGLFAMGRNSGAFNGTSGQPTSIMDTSYSPIQPQQATMPQYDPSQVNQNVMGTLPPMIGYGSQNPTDPYGG